MPLYRGNGELKVLGLHLNGRQFYTAFLYELQPN